VADGLAGFSALGAQRSGQSLGLCHGLRGLHDPFLKLGISGWLGACIAHRRMPFEGEDIENPAFTKRCRRQVTGTFFWLSLP